jgi:hypothetical protein
MVIQQVKKWNPDIHNFIYKSQPLTPILTQQNPVHGLTPYHFQVQTIYNVIIFYCEESAPCPNTKLLNYLLFAVLGLLIPHIHSSPQHMEAVSSNHNLRTCQLTKKSIQHGYLSKTDYSLM